MCVLLKESCLQSLWLFQNQTSAFQDKKKGLGCPGSAGHTEGDLCLRVSESQHCSALLHDNFPLFTHLPGLLNNQVISFIFK